MKCFKFIIAVCAAVCLTLSVNTEAKKKDPACERILKNYVVEEDSRTGSSISSNWVGYEGKTIESAWTTILETVADQGFTVLSSNKEDGMISAKQEGSTYDTTCSVFVSVESPILKVKVKMSIKLKTAIAFSKDLSKRQCEFFSKLEQNMGLTIPQ